MDEPLPAKIERDAIYAVLALPDALLDAIDCNAGDRVLHALAYGGRAAAYMVADQLHARLDELENLRKEPREVGT